MMELQIIKHNLLSSVKKRNSCLLEPNIQCLSGPWEKKLNQRLLFFQQEGAEYQVHVVLDHIGREQIEEVVCQNSKKNSFQNADLP